MRTDHTRATRRRGAALAAVAVALTALTTGAPAAGGQVPGPTITVTPSSGIADGDAVQVDVEGLSYPWAVMQCPAAVLDDLGPGDYPPNLPGCGNFTLGGATVVMRSVEAVGSTVRRCGVTAGDCALVAFSALDGGVVGTSVDMLPPPPLVLPDGTAGEAGLPLRALVTVSPETTVTLAQCAAPVGPDASSSNCSPPQAVPLDANGFGDVPFVLVEDVATPQGRQLRRRRVLGGRVRR